MLTSRFIPAGAMKVSAKDSDAVAYIYTSPKGRPAAIIYVGKAIKPHSWFSFKTEADREQHVQRQFASRAVHMMKKADKAAERRAWANPYKPGDLFRRVWGYDQTNVDWYEVVAVRGKRMFVREISQEQRETEWCVGKCVPLPGQYRGDPLTVMAQDGRIKINHYAHAYYVEPTIVGGVKTYGADRYSSYA